MYEALRKKAGEVVHTVCGSAELVGCLFCFVLFSCCLGQRFNFGKTGN